MQLPGQNPRQMPRLVLPHPNMGHVIPPMHFGPRQTYRPTDIYITPQCGARFARPITPHTVLMANLLQSGAPYIHILSQSATNLLVVWTVIGDGGALTSKAHFTKLTLEHSKVNLLNDDTYR